MKKILIFGVTISALVCGVVGVRLFAAQTAMTDQQIARIQTNCVSAKKTLNQLHVSDALLRVNMGQTYESISSKLIDRFATRASLSGLDVSTLSNSSSKYKLALDKFRADYQAYEQHLTDAIAIDCTKQPVAFYDSVLVARAARAVVNKDVVDINFQTEQYKTALAQFEANYIKSPGAR